MDPRGKRRNAVAKRKRQQVPTPPPAKKAKGKATGLKSKASTAKAIAAELSTDPANTPKSSKAVQSAAEAILSLAFSAGTYCDNWRVGDWLARQGLAHYIDIFSEHEVVSALT